MTMIEKLFKALAKIGRSGVFAPPKTDNSQDELLHYLLIDREARSFFTSQAEASLKEVLKLVPYKEITSLVDSVAKRKLGRSKTLLEAEHYSLILQVSAPSSSLDKETLRKELVRAGLEELLVDEIISKSTTENAPAKTYKVVERV